MHSLLGLPAHPLLVHIPIVLVPLATLLFLLAIWRPARRPALIAGAVLAVVGAIGVVLAVQAGGSLEEATPRSELVHDHTEAGDRAQAPTIVFGVVTLLGVGALEARGRAEARAAVDRASSTTTSSASPMARWLLPVVVVASLVTGAISTTLVLDAGHTGAKAVWHDQGEAGG